MSKVTRASQGPPLSQRRSGRHWPEAAAGDVHPAPKKVFVPGTLLGESARILGAGEVEIVYALPLDVREGATSADGQAERVRASEAALDAALPEIHALHGLGAASQLAVTAEMLDKAEQLEVVFVPSVGTDAIDIDAATVRGVLVVNAAGSNYTSVAEHTVGLMLGLSRMIGWTDRLAHRDRRQWRRHELGTWPGVLHGECLGLVGFGYIGREVARMCRAAFDMRVLAYDPYFPAIEAERQGVELVENLQELIGDADFLSVHTPLTADTRHLINRDRLHRMKRTAYLINTSRGPIVDTDALVTALQSGQIAGAGLDVTDPEPLPDDHPLMALDNVILTPHLAGAAESMIDRAARMSAEDALRALRGQRPQNLVNPEAWPAFVARRTTVKSRRT